VKIAVDASALLAIFLGEPEADRFVACILAAERAYVSPVTWWEVQAVMHSRFGAVGEAKSAAWIEQAGISVEPATLEQAQIAVNAFASYRGRPARLNLGDCFAYALARSLAIPLLFKGSDFAGTDVEAV